jgi:hypothetical protein
MATSEASVLPESYAAGDVRVLSAADRKKLRTALFDVGFERRKFIRTEGGGGKETWFHPDGSAVLVEWLPRLDDAELPIN